MSCLRDCWERPSQEGLSFWLGPLDRFDLCTVGGHSQGGQNVREYRKFVDIDFEQKVRQAAYHLWEADGRPYGQEKDYWFTALQKLLDEREQPKGDKLLKS